MLIDINIYDIWARLQQAAQGPIPVLPATPMLQYLYLDGVRQQARRPR